MALGITREREEAMVVSWVAGLVKGPMPMSLAPKRGMKRGGGRSGEEEEQAVALWVIKPCRNYLASRPLQVMIFLIQADRSKTTYSGQP